MKKAVLFTLILTVVLCACNRKAFVNKIMGTWKLNKYIFISGQSRQDLTATFADTTNRKFELTLSGNNDYTISYNTIIYRADTTIYNIDSVYDSLNTTWTWKYDTVPRVDSTITPYSQGGKWYLLNSEEDLQLVDNADTGAAQIFRINTLTKSSLDIVNGNKEYDLTK